MIIRDWLYPESVSLKDIHRYQYFIKQNQGTTTSLKEFIEISEKYF